MKRRGAKIERRSAKLGATEQAELERCKVDVSYWINQYCVTYDPRLLESGKDPYLPFQLFPIQEGWLEWMQERAKRQQQGLVEKSRDMGATFLAAAYALHGWLFKPGFSAGFGSRKQELVDKLGDPDSIFEKIRVMLYRLPKWMLPKGFDDGCDNFCRLVNPATGATITGEGGDEIGRGGRKTVYFIDEAAFLARPELVDRALLETTPVRIYISTPNGNGNPFFKKRFSGTIPVYTFHWKDDLRKNHYEIRDSDGELLSIGNGRVEEVPAGARVVYPWYEEKKATTDPVALAQEIDIDYSASIDGVCIPAKWVQAAVDAHIVLGIEPRGEIVAGLDVAASGNNRNVLTTRQGIVVKRIRSWSEPNTTHTAKRTAEHCVSDGVSVLTFDTVGVGVGVSSAFASNDLPFTFQWKALNGGESADASRYWDDGRTSKEKFLNKRAELWGLLRQRFEKTYERVVLGIAHPDEELISIPNEPELISQLSMPLRQSTSNGKEKVESKDDMKKRGVSSPDFADSLAYTEDSSLGWGWTKAQEVMERAEMQVSLTPPEQDWEDDDTGSEALNARW